MICICLIEIKGSSLSLQKVKLFAEGSTAALSIWERIAFQFQAIEAKAAFLMATGLTKERGQNAAEGSHLPNHLGTRCIGRKGMVRTEVGFGVAIFRNRGAAVVCALRVARVFMQ